MSLALSFSVLFSIQLGFVIKHCGFLIKAHSYPEYIVMLAVPQAQAAEAAYRQRA